MQRNLRIQNTFVPDFPTSYVDSKLKKQSHVHSLLGSRGFNVEVVSLPILSATDKCLDYIWSIFGLRNIFSIGNKQDG